MSQFGFFNHKDIKDMNKAHRDSFWNQNNLDDFTATSLQQSFHKLLCLEGMTIEIPAECSTAAFRVVAAVHMTTQTTTVKKHSSKRTGTNAALKKFRHMRFAVCLQAITTRMRAHGRQVAQWEPLLWELWTASCGGGTLATGELHTLFAHTLFADTAKEHEVAFVALMTKPFTQWLSPKINQ